MRLRPNQIPIVSATVAALVALVVTGVLLSPPPEPQVTVEAARAGWAARFSYYVPEVEATVRAGEALALRAVFIANGVEVGDALALVEASARPQRVVLAATQGQPERAAGWSFELLARRSSAAAWTTIASGDVAP